MTRSLRSILAVAFVALLAGCASTPVVTESPHDETAPAAIAPLAFAPMVTVDKVRIASEPSIKSTADGTLVVAAPTGSVKYATRPLDILTEANQGAFQSAIWVSRDNGTTWTFSDLAGVLPYHDPLPGAGDAELAVDSAGTIYMADQLGLASEVVSISKDNGATWQAASPLGSGIPDVDRMWMWPDPTTAGTVYMVYDHNTQSINVAKTTDGGMTWTATAATTDSTAPGPIVATNRTVAFSYFGAGLQYTHSEDQGKTWKVDDVQGVGEVQDLFPQTVADLSGNLYVAWLEKAKGTDGTNVTYIVSHDAGKTWNGKQVAYTQPGRAIFLWAVAGSDGRLGFSWYGANKTAGPYYEESAIVLGAGTPQATTFHARVTELAARPDAPCEGGVGCTSGRELGDFQTCAVTPDGHLVVSFVTVQGENPAGQPAGGHVAFARQAAGPSLFASGETIAPWAV